MLLPVLKSTPINNKKKESKNNISLNNPVPKQQLSAAQRDKILMQQSEDDVMFKKDVASAAIGESNEINELINFIACPRNE